MSVSPFSVLKSPTSKKGVQRCAMALIISGQEEPRGERSPRERPVAVRLSWVFGKVPISANKMGMIGTF
jgi:hypothetical protein